LVTGEIERHSAHAVVIASGGYGNVFFLSTNAMEVATAAWKIHKKGAFTNPCYTQIHQHVFLFQEIINQINFDVRVIA
jgi:succinate dehydrogenase / fumarate reductase flavoprotein subunit